VGWRDMDVASQCIGIPLFRAHCVGWRRCNKRSNATTCLRSKPTAWDGDSAISNARTQPSLVLSPLCGMVTNVFFSSSCRAGVLSPLCGMEISLLDGEQGQGPRLSSKPTVWDGDIFAFIVVLPALLCSKPTVWDGDSLLRSHTRTG
jgi:hypothetical protein